MENAEIIYLFVIKHKIVSFFLVLTSDLFTRHYLYIATIETITQTYTNFLKNTPLKIMLLFCTNEKLQKKIIYKLLKANVFSQAVFKNGDKTKCKFSLKTTKLYDLCIDSNILDLMVVK